MCELSCFIMFAIISYVLLNIIAASSSLPPPMNGHILRCAAGRLRPRPDRAPETRNDGTPRHHCMNCRQPMCGGACGVQWADKAERTRRGFVFPITSLHPDGQEEFKQTNNDHVLIYFLCGEEKMSDLQNSNDHDLMR